MMVPDKKHLNLAYWNANGIQNKIHETYFFLQTYFIDILCISETFLKSEANLHHHPDFTIYRNDRPDEQRKGGVMIIIRKNIAHQVLPVINTKLVENLGVAVQCGNQTIQIFSCYLPGGTSANDVASHYQRDLTLITRRRNKYFAMGDLNSRHRLWNCFRANAAGNILFEKLNGSNFRLLHPPDHTHFPEDSNKRPSTIDLVLTN